MVISALTYIGTDRKLQQDAVLIENELITDGILVKENIKVACCFVADGVSGSSDGAFASTFVLKGIQNLSFFSTWENNVRKLKSLNQQFINHILKLGQNSATTLSGIFFTNEGLQIFQAGDSEIHLIRGGAFFPLAATHNETVENIMKNYPGINLDQAYEKASNTLTSYFGSQTDHLVFDIDWKRRIKLPIINGIQKNDRILISSDGLFKSITRVQLKEIIFSDIEKLEMLEKVKQKTIQYGSPDNLSLILIEF